MSAAEFRRLKGALGLSNGPLAKLLGVGRRTPQKWAKGEQPVHQSSALLMRLMVRYGLTPEVLASLDPVNPHLTRRKVARRGDELDTVKRAGVIGILAKHKQAGNSKSR